MISTTLPPRTRRTTARARLGRRGFLAGIGGAAVTAGGAALVGCATGAPAPAPAAPAAPGAGQRVVALDEFAALAALSVGVAPAAVFATFGYPASLAVLRAAGTEERQAPDGPQLEAVAAARPDRIVGVSIPTTVDAAGRLGEIAPVTVVEYSAGWEDQLRAVAGPLGRDADAQQVVDRITARVDATRADLAATGSAGRTVSVLGALGAEAFALVRTGGPGALLAGLDLARPAPQDVDRPATDPFVPLAAERLTEHDADHLFLLSGSLYDPAALTGAPLWGRLGAVGAGRVSEVLGEMWFGGSAFAVDWILADVRAALLGDGAVRREADAVAHWSAFAG